MAKKKKLNKPVKKSTPNNKEEGAICIQRGKFDSLNIYEVTESELDILEKGSPNNLYLNFSIFLLSIASSFLATILTVNKDLLPMRIYVIFVIVCSVGFIVGIFLLLMWFKIRKNAQQVIKTIKLRLKEE